jgi:hypothetical protein
MIVRDNQGKVVAELQHLRDAQGNTIDSVTSYSNERPAVQILTTRDTQGRVESRTILGGKLLP